MSRQFLEFVEPTSRHLLRRSLVLGVPMSALTLLGVSLVAVQMLVPGHLGWIATGILGFSGFLALRLATKFSRTGWEEVAFFWIEVLVDSLRFKVLERTHHSQSGDLKSISSLRDLAVSPALKITSPDAMTPEELRLSKDSALLKVYAMCYPDTISFITTYSKIGDRCEEVQLKKWKEVDTHHAVVSPRRRFPDLSEINLPDAISGIFPSWHVYQLHQLPTRTDPLWLFEILGQALQTDPLSKEHDSLPQLWVLTRIDGKDQFALKTQIESSRRAHSFAVQSGAAEMDETVAEEHAERISYGLASGTEALVEVSLVIVSPTKLKLDKDLFLEESSPLQRRLAVFAALGVRPRPHRSQIARAVTATDLIATLGDPLDPKRPSLASTPRGKPLYFDLQDPAFPALHINVSGTTGVGKSVVTGALMHRMREAQTPMSCIFIDYLRSYRRLVRSVNGIYLEPSTLSQLRQDLQNALKELEFNGQFSGIELSNLPEADRQEGAREVLCAIQYFLVMRTSAHPVYIVMDECWRLLKDEPALVQQLFRVCRKLDGAAVAITQSLVDLLKDESGEAIFQNAPIQLVLRQREDPARYQSALGLSSREVDLVRRLKLEKGHFTDLLIKTPIESRLARFYLSEAEHDLHRTDNLRSESRSGLKLKLHEQTEDQSQEAK